MVSLLQPLLRPLISRRLDDFQRRFSYDVAYLRDLLAVSPRAFRAFAPMTRLSSHHEDTPTDALYAAKLVATLSEDCGTCAQLVVTMAEREGVGAATLRAVVAGDAAALDAMAPDAALGFRFARALLTRAPALEILRERVQQRWGRRALITLGLGVASARVYPIVKYALGYGHACQRVRVGDTELRPGVAVGAAAPVAGAAAATGAPVAPA